MMRTIDLLRQPAPLFREIRTSLRRDTPSVVLLLIIVGCGGGGAPLSQAPVGATPTKPQATAATVPTAAPTVASTAGSGSVDACALLTPKEVSAAYGSTLDVAVPSADELYAYCTYQSSVGGKLRTFITKSSAAATSGFGTMKINKGVAVSGVGDEAFWSTDSFAPGLYFLKGGVMGFISGSQGGPEGLDDPIIGLGKLLASRM